MTTLIIQNVTATPLKFENAYSLNPVYISGVASKLTIHFQNSSNSIITGEQKLLVLQGEYKHDRKLNNYTLFNAQLVDLPNEDTWLLFLLEYFMQYIPLITIDTLKSKSPEFTNSDRVSISAFTQHHYIDCTIAIDCLKITKIEFGRYMKEKGENLTSWTKGVFINKAPHYIEFIQTSFDGEGGGKYSL